MEGHLYQALMEDYITEADKEMYLEASSVNSFYLKDNLQIPYVKDQLAKQSTRNKITEFTAKFIDNNAERLSTSGPVHIVTFMDKEINFFYDMFKITKSEVLAKFENMISIVYPGVTTFNILKKSPHKILLIAMLIDALQNDYEDVVECCRYIFGFIEYPIQYRNFWKLGVKEDVMIYTIEHLPSNKFKAKKLNNLLALLKYDVSSSIDFLSAKLKEGRDEVYVVFANRVRTQIRNTFVNIANLYYKNYENNANTNVTSTKLDDGNLAEQEGQNKIIASIIDRTYNKFISGEIDHEIIKMIAEATTTDRSNLEMFLNMIFTDKGNRLDKMIEDLVTYYFIIEPTASSVGTGEFLNFGLKLFRSLPTSKHELCVEIREILDMWMNKIIKIKNYYKGSTTISCYSRAIFNYIVFMINHYN